MIKTHFFIRNSANTPTKDQVNKFDDFDHSTDDETSENENASTSTEESISDRRIAFQFWRKIKYPAELLPQ